MRQRAVRKYTPAFDVSMADRLITLNLRYAENVRLKRHHNFSRLIRNNECFILVREVALKEAPIAYNIRTMEKNYGRGRDWLKLRFVERQHKVRLFDQRLWWPLLTDGDLMTFPRFVKQAASGELSEFMASQSLPMQSLPSRLCTLPLGQIEALVQETGTSDYVDRIARALNKASKLMICGEHLYVEGGEPIWYALPRTRYAADLEMSVGPEALDLWGSWVPGPDRETRLNCFERNLAFGLDESDATIAQMRARGSEIRVRSKISAKSTLHKPETATVMCARALVANLWKDRTASALFPVNESSPKRGSEPPANLNCQEVLTRLVTTELWLPTKIAAGKAILARLNAFGYSALAFDDGVLLEQDDAAFGSIADGM
jgi:hypothetical protein